MGKNMYHRKSQLVITIALVSLGMTSLLSINAFAGGSCAVAKKLGNSIAIEWVANEYDSAETAIYKAKKTLIDKGYRKWKQDVFTQASSDLPHAHFVVIESTYKTTRNKQRTSFGCGFSDISAKEAEWAALRDLQSYSWGWKPSLGYELVKQLQY